MCESLASQALALFDEALPKAIVVLFELRFEGFVQIPFFVIAGPDWHDANKHAFQRVRSRRARYIHAPAD